jgi:signal transduction histidine kinase/CheY-like chemotaxis protein
MTASSFRLGYLLPPLLGVVLTVVLLFLVLAKSARDGRSRLFAVLLGSLGVWCLVTFGMRISPTAAAALPWEKALVVSALCVYVIYYHFTTTYVRKRKQGIVVFCYALLLTLVLLLALTDLVIEDVRTASYGYAPITGPLGGPAFGSSFVLIICGIVNLLRAYRASGSSDERNRILYLAAAGIFPLIGGGLDGFTDLPPAAIWANLIFCLICSVAILKYHLLDIRIVIRKSLAYLFMSVLIGLPYAALLMLLNSYLRLQSQTWWVHSLLILTLALILRPLHSRAQIWVDRVFYRDRYNYLQALERFSRHTQSISELDQLSTTIVELVTGALRTRCASLLLVSPQDGHFYLSASTDASSMSPAAVIREGSPLVRWLERSPNILSVKELDIAPQLQNLSLWERQRIASLDPGLFMPLLTVKNRLFGILVVGAKATDQSFSSEDTQMLSTLSRHLSMVLQNAQLYEDALQSRRNLEDWLNSMTDCVVIVSPDSSIQFMNETAIKHFGNWTGRPCPANLVKLAEYTAAILKHQQQPGSGNNNRCLHEFAGREYEIAAAPLLNPGRDLSVIHVLRDISERKRMEEERRKLEQRAQINSRLVAIGEMASGIAHEINNPLTAVIGYAHLLLEQDIPENLRADLVMINEGAQRVSGIVNRLLTFARQHRPQRVAVDVNTIIASTLDLYAYELKTSNIRVSSHLAGGELITVADPGQLQQLFLNIIVNAEKEMKIAHNGGRLTIRSRQQDGWIRVTFGDDGRGIPTENLERIFDPFFSTREVGEGTGLGLSVCHGIVSEHGGRIYAENVQPGGTTFIIELPVVRAETALPPTSALTEQRAVQGAKIMVIDDEQAIRELISQVLTKEGHRVTAVDNAEQALATLQIERYSLILMDMKMPGMSGMELYGRIQSIAESLARRVVFITGDVMGEDTKQFFEGHQVRYITKPFGIQKLKREINSLLSVL